MLLCSYQGGAEMYYGCITRLLKVGDKQAAQHCGAGFTGSAGPHGWSQVSSSSILGLQLTEVATEKLGGHMNSQAR